MKDLDESRSSSTSSLINVPATVGKYRLLDEVGHGAMGTVFRAHDPALDRIVAVKMIACPTADGSLSERFQREARLAASLNHPNIVTVYDFGQAECGFYMVMELLEGADLATALRRDQLRTLEDRLQTIEQIAEGVAFAHQRGLIHRDLKPANIHRDPQGRVKILDFGLARSSEPALTTVGAVFGTPRYMAPEQVKGEPFDMRSDVFSLGAILYEILGGEPCFPAASVHAAIFQVLERQPPSLVELDPTVPPLLARIVEKALAKQPKRRFPDAVALRLALVELRRVLQGESSESHAFSALAFSRRPAAPGKLASGAGGPDVAGSTDGSANAVAQASAAGPLHLTFMGEPGGERQLIVGHPHQESLLDVSLKASIPHFHECGGRGRCSTCRVRVIAGAQGLTPRNRVETQLAQRLGWGDDIRLACQAKPVGDIAVKRLIRDTDDFGLLRFEQDQKPPEEHALAVLTCTLSQFS
ncbi:MAG: protein kinase, partial [Acidobacteriota bacterium]